MDRRYQHFDRRMEREHPNTWSNVHQDCRHAIFNYLVHGYNPGGFLTAVMTNDLYRAAATADIENSKRLTRVANFVTQALPSCCYGSHAAMEAWRERTDQERELLLIDRALLPTLFEVIRNPDGELT